MDVQLSHVAFDTLEVSKEETGRMDARKTGLDLFHLYLSLSQCWLFLFPSPVSSFLQQLQPSLLDTGLSSLSLIWSGKSYVSTDSWKFSSFQICKLFKYTIFILGWTILLTRSDYCLFASDIKQYLKDIWWVSLLKTTYLLQFDFVEWYFWNQSEDRYFLYLFECIASDSLEGLVHVNGFFGTGLKIGDVVLTLTPRLSSLCRYLCKIQSIWGWNDELQQGLHYFKSLDWQCSQF